MRPIRASIIRALGAIVAWTLPFGATAQDFESTRFPTDAAELGAPAASLVPRATDGSSFALVEAQGPINFSWYVLRSDGTLVREYPNPANDPFIGNNSSSFLHGSDQLFVVEGWGSGRRRMFSVVGGGSWTTASLEPIAATGEYLTPLGPDGSGGMFFSLQREPREHLLRVAANGSVVSDLALEEGERALASDAGAVLTSRVVYEPEIAFRVREIRVEGTTDIGTFSSSPLAYRRGRLAVPVDDRLAVGRLTATGFTAEYSLPAGVFFTGTVRLDDSGFALSSDRDGTSLGGDARGVFLYECSQSADRLGEKIGRVVGAFDRGFLAERYRYDENGTYLPESNAVIFPRAQPTGRNFCTDLYILPVGQCRKRFYGGGPGDSVFPQSSKEPMPERCRFAVTLRSRESGATVPFTLRRQSRPKVRSEITRKGRTVLLDVEMGSKGSYLVLRPTSKDPALTTTEASLTIR